jgi:hypothetical protein
VPEVDGYPISERIVDVSPEECVIAVGLATKP